MFDVLVPFNQLKESKTVAVGPDHAAQQMFMVLTSHDESFQMIFFQNLL